MFFGYLVRAEWGMGAEPHMKMAADGQTTSRMATGASPRRDPLKI